MEDRSNMSRNYSAKEINLDKVCRTCLDESNIMKSIFASEENIAFSTLVNSCTKLFVTEGDTLPKLICNTCINSVKSAFSFKKRAEKADAELREYIGRNQLNPIAHIKQEIIENSTENVNFETVNVYYDDPANYSSDSEDDNPLSLLASSNTDVEKKPVNGCKKNIKNHVDDKWSTTSLFRCNFCDSSFHFKADMIFHLNMAHIKEFAIVNGKQLSRNDPLSEEVRVKKILDIVKIETEVKKEIKSVSNSESNGEETDEEIPTSSQTLNVSQNINIPYDNTCGVDQPTCKICDKTFTTLKYVKRHVKIHCSLEKLVCADFNKKLTLLYDHKKVLNVKIDNLTDDYLSDIICEDVQIGNIDRYVANMKSIVLPDTKPKENNLKTKASKKSKVISQFQHQHKCTLCDKTFARPNHIIRHMKTHDYVFPHKCDQCLRVFANDKSLDKHKRLLCKNLTKPFECALCRHRFMEKTALSKHIRKNHRENYELMRRNVPEPADISLKCPHCNKVFKNQKYLYRHCKRHVVEKIECPVCQKMFKQKSYLRRHMRVHIPMIDTKINKHLCVYCGRFFQHFSNLIVHIRRHTGEKPHKCDMCDSAFPRSTDLLRHKLTHTGEKASICSVCDKAFCRPSKLARHMRIHTGDRPYKCTYCDRAFTQSNDLTLHIRRHTGEKPFACNVCGENFIQGTALRLHREKYSHFDKDVKPKLPIVDSDSEFSEMNEKKPNIAVT